MKITVHIETHLPMQAWAWLKGLWLDFRLATVNQAAPFVPEMVLERRRMRDIMESAT